MTGEEQFWRGLFALLVIAALGIAAIPQLAVLVGHAISAHGEAMRAAYQGYTETYQAARTRQSEGA